MGSINLALPEGNITLGLMQELVPNQGDAWQFMLDEIDGVVLANQPLPIMKGNNEGFSKGTWNIKDTIVDKKWTQYSMNSFVIRNYAYKLHKVILSTAKKFTDPAAIRKEIVNILLHAAGHTEYKNKEQIPQNTLKVLLYHFIKVENDKYIKW
jgi:hypothetical protein